MAKKKSLKNSKKSKTGKYIVSIIVIAIIAVAVYLLMQYVEPDQTVAIVNGEKINQSELDEKFDNLPEQYKVVQMSFFEDKSHGEISVELGIPLGTVKSRMRLAFERIKNFVGETV